MYHLHNWEGVLDRAATHMLRSAAQFVAERDVDALVPTCKIPTEFEF